MLWISFGSPLKSPRSRCHAPRLTPLALLSSGDGPPQAVAEQPRRKATKLPLAAHVGTAAQDDKEAVRWYRKAAEQNHAAAQCNLGMCYANGRGIEMDAKEAEAAKLNNEKV